MYKQATQLTLNIATLMTLCTLAACSPHVPHKTDAKNDQTVVTFAVHSLDLGHYKTLAQSFNAAHPTIQVQIQEADALFSLQDNLSPGDELCLLALSVDAFLYYEMDPTTLSASGVVYDLQPLLERHPEFASDDFFPGLLARFAEHERLWGIPAGVEPLLVYYNRSLFDAAGMDYPQPGWTWDDFLDTALALTNLDTGVWGFVEQYRYGSAGAFIYQHGGTLIDKDGPNFSDPLAVEALNWYTDLARTHHVMPGPNSPDAPRPEGNNLPQIGRAAMWIGVPDQTHNMNTGVVSLPRDQQDAAMTNVPAYYVSAGTAYPEAA
jgi:multiple sugar transport system substrate-binding protein